MIFLSVKLRTKTHGDLLLLPRGDIRRQTDPDRERINPTGKPKFKQALKDKDLTYILSMGVAQQESRADVLDVNVGLPGIDEPQMMVDVVKELQGVLDLPLQIDTSDRWPWSGRSGSTTENR